MFSRELLDYTNTSKFHLISKVITSILNQLDRCK